MSNIGSKPIENSITHGSKDTGTLRPPILSTLSLLCFILGPVIFFLVASSTSHLSGIVQGFFSLVFSLVTGLILSYRSVKRNEKYTLISGFGTWLNGGSLILCTMLIIALIVGAI